MFACYNCFAQHLVCPNCRSPAPPDELLPFARRPAWKTTLRPPLPATTTTRDDHEHPARTTPRPLTTTTRRRSRRRGNRPSRRRCRPDIDNNNYNCDFCCCSCALAGHALFGHLFRIIVRNNVAVCSGWCVRSAVRWRRGGPGTNKFALALRRGVAHKAWATAAAHRSSVLLIC